jgi:hypothetical protein
MDDGVFFFVPYSEVLPKEVQWFWEAVEEGELPFAYDEVGGPRLDSHPLEEDDLRWVLSPDADDRAAYVVGVLVVDRGR